MNKNFYSDSIFNFYNSLRNVKRPGFTVPAINIRTLTFDFAKTLFSVAKKEKVKYFIIELARSEMKYTKQDPKEFSKIIQMAAFEEKFKGPIFLQGDHFQINKLLYGNKQKCDLEILNLKKLIKKAIKNNFYNIDIDCSPLDLKENLFLTIYFLNYIKKIQPKNINISVGGEVGEIGKKDTTKKDLISFINFYKKILPQNKNIGLIKLAIQYKTKHGGIITKKGKIKIPKLDFELISDLSNIAKEESFAGIVFHGASTLPIEILKKLPQVGVLEVHLATKFQNIILDSKYFPEDLKEKMYKWVKENFEKKPNETEIQFIFRNRKYALGKFKRDILKIPKENIKKICEELEAEFTLIFRALKINGIS
ncbi:MAG: class II fructose-bisphosphate aldolase [Minisyncoccia bacterium]